MTADHTPERRSADEWIAVARAAVAEVGNQPHLPGLRATVNGTLAAHLADVEARLTAVEALADEWLGWADGRSTPRIDAFRDAAEALKVALHPAPDDPA